MPKIELKNVYKIFGEDPNSVFAFGAKRSYKRRNTGRYLSYRGA
jgi:hypothetical protein